jgi:glutamine synthetase
MVGNRERAANLEVKCADLAANPYLLVAGVLAAGLDGSRRSLTLPEEITGDPAALDPAEAEKRGVRRLPTSLPDAIEEFEAGPLPRAAYGTLIADAVLAVRRGEAARCEGLDAEAVAEAYRWVY